MSQSPNRIPNLHLADPTPIVSVKSIDLPFPGRGEDLQVKVSAPVAGDQLPIILFSHGFGSSLEGYGPLADFWAAHGFVVIQPTHLDSKTIGLAHEDPRTPQLWRFRVDDHKRILDHLDLLESKVPGLRGRTDRSRIAAAGHSFGGQTAGILLGLRVVDPETKQEHDMSDARVKAGVLLATAGRGEPGDLTTFASENLPWLNGTNFAGMATPALVVVGDADDSPLTVRGPEWMADPYLFSPGRKSLLTLFGAEHFLGGISGYEVTETTDEDPERVALVQLSTWAYLRYALGIEGASWQTVNEALSEGAHRLGRLESK